MNKPPYCRANSIPYVQATKRARLSRQRLEAVEELARQPRAWRLWAVCVDQTAGYSKGSDKTYVVTLANLAGMRDDKASVLLRQFDEHGVFTWRKQAGKRSPGLLSLPRLTEGTTVDPRFAAPLCGKCGKPLSTGDLDIIRRRAAARGEAPVFEHPFDDDCTA